MAYKVKGGWACRWCGSVVSDNEDDVISHEQECDENIELKNKPK
jgi:hypothetical protein